MMPDRQQRPVEGVDTTDRVVPIRPRGAASAERGSHQERGQRAASFVDAPDVVDLRGASRAESPSPPPFRQPWPDGTWSTPEGESISPGEPDIDLRVNGVDAADHRRPGERDDAQVPLQPATVAEAEAAWGEPDEAVLGSADDLATGVGDVSSRMDPTVPTDAAERALLDPDGLVLPAAVSSRLLGALWPAAAVLVVASLVAAVALTFGSISSDRADDLADARISSAAIDAAVSDAWLGVVEVVAGGVGQQLDGAERVASAAAVAGGLLDERPPAVGDAVLVATARDDQRRAVDRLTEVIAETDGDPVELGNQLELLDAEVSAARSAAAALDSQLRELELDARTETQRARLIALLAVVVGVAATIGAAFAARRRWSRAVDQPLDELRRAASRPLGAEGDRPAARVVADASVPPEFRVLADDLLGSRRRDEQRIRELEDRAVWVDRGRQVLEALELADDEPGAIEVSARALRSFGPHTRVELLMSAKGSTRLERVAAGAGQPLPGCPVTTSGNCVAMRRGQVSVFESSESINACPLLRHRPVGACSAVCVPVMVGGQPGGVLHMTGPDSSPPAAVRVEQLVSLSSRLGARVSALRVLERSRQEAATDGLTGLPNRRALEAEIADLLSRDVPFALVLADLDRFKLLNDNYGHETGDRALQLFAGVLRDNVRGNDVVARLGGEEFVLVYPTMSVETSVEAIDRLRQALDAALGRTDLPYFTCSFGVADSSVAADGDAILRVADAGLLRAKHLGGDQAVIADADLAAEVFRNGDNGRSVPPADEGR